MDPTSIPLFAMLRDRLGYLSERQRVIAQNVANADTAGYAAQDLKPFSFQVQAAAAQMTGVQSTTQPGHLTAPHASRRGLGGGTFKPVRMPDSETTLDGNSVVLEEEMMKMSEARMSYEAAIGFYQKSLSLLRMAARPPGRG
jgi:flagellar basal-body rod protein FlgB